MRLRVLPQFCLVVLLGMVSSGSAQDMRSGAADKQCHEHPQLSGPCFTVHGRMGYANGTPTVRILVIGTKRILGVSDSRFAVPGYCNLPEPLRATLEANREIFADFVVCPFTPDQPGMMRLVCVDDAHNVRTRQVGMW